MAGIRLHSGIGWLYVREGNQSRFLRGRGDREWP
jgi:hypothetical protein